MTDIVVGLIAALIGLLLTVRGYPTFRLLLSLYGAFAGFMVGVALASQLTDSGVLQGVVGWVGGFLGALIVGALVYTFYAVAVILGVGSIGFTLGAGAMAAAGIQTDWIILTAGIVAAVILAVFALVADLPAILVVILTAVTGAGLVVTAAMLLVGSITSNQLWEQPGDYLQHAGWWWAGYAAVAILGIVVQSRYLRGAQKAVRSTWR